MSGLRELKLLAVCVGFGALCACGDLIPRDTSSLLFPGFQRSEIVGFLAGLGTTFAALPDLLAMLKRRSSAGINPRMATIMCVFQVLWMYYGLLISSRPVIAWNLIAILINSFLVLAYRYFARKEREAAGGHPVGGMEALGGSGAK